jgi:hypothetical protein
MFLLELINKTMGFQNTKEIAEFLEKNKPMTKESLAQLKILSQQ